MENRDRDKMSRSTTPTEAGEVNRKTSQDLGRTQSGSNAEFGENIGRSENWENEPGSRKDSGSMSGGRKNLESDVSDTDKSNTGRH
ncbi:MAG TPA: hypothetical protein VGR02_00845 [Thermoanaerobaculia bacterium]|jgi:hypothetical protein|nr:hypothetical protein [Thermoanaerobaculia bacterium]